MNGRAERKQRDAAGGGEELLFLPLGGAGEIGMNLNLFGYRGRWLMVDCGVTFADEQVPGVDVLMPDPGWIADRAQDIDGLVLTHAHEDHIGAVPYLWERFRCPMWATPFTAAVLKRKLQDVGLEEVAKIHVLKPGARFRVGRHWDVEMVTLTHSIPEPNALLIRTPMGTLFHTGDWKLDPTPLIGQPVDEAQLRRIGDAGVLACIGDSTNVFRAGVAGSEAEVRESLIELVKRYEKRVVIACFASNVARLETVAAVAAATKRHAALVGRSLWRIYDAAKETGYLRDIRPFLSEQEAANLPRERALMVATGSQGEPRAALARIAAGTHPNVTLDPGDTVIFSSRIIPGNERAIARLHDALALLGAEVVTEKDHFVHVSGHPARDELVQMYQWIRPQILVPVHGEARHMYEHEKLGQQMQIPHTIVATNGQMVRLAPGRPEIVDEVPAGRLVLDGTQLVPLDGAVIKQRKRMLYNGSAVATVVLDRKGRLVADPQLSLHGLAEEGAERELEDAIVGAIEEALARLGGGERADDNAVEEAAYRAIRRTVLDAKGKKPTTAVHVVRI
jgi:ribonuclease J